MSKYLADPPARIYIRETFSDDGQRYIKSEVRLVSHEKAGYFCGLGWAQAVKEDGSMQPPVPADLTEKTLEVQNGVHVASSTSP